LLWQKGEWLAILWLKVLCTTPLKRPNGFVCDCVPAVQSKAKNISAGWARQKANGWRFSEIPAHTLWHDFRHLMGKHEIPIRRFVSELLIIRSRATSQAFAMKRIQACATWSEKSNPTSIAQQRYGEETKKSAVWGKSSFRAYLATPSLDAGQISG
jgi:hypothetical protein